MSINVKLGVLRAFVPSRLRALNESFPNPEFPVFRSPVSGFRPPFSTRKKDLATIKKKIPSLHS